MRGITFPRLLLVGLTLVFGTTMVYGQVAQWRAFTDGGWIACRDGKYAKAAELLDQAVKAASGSGISPCFN